jgi:anti-anti-sigma factor
LGSLENFPVRLTGQQAVVTLPAEIDIGNADQITDTLLAVLNQGVTTLVADMTATTFCAVAGASALARAHRRAAANQADLRVAVRTPAVRRLLALTWVDRLILVTDSVPAALAGDEPGATAAVSAADIAAGGGTATRMAGAEARTAGPEPASGPEDEDPAAAAVT